MARCNVWTDPSSRISSSLFSTVSSSKPAINMGNPKQDIAHIELDNSPVKNGLTPEEAELQEALRNYVPNTEAEKKLRRKIDLHLIPVLWIMYILNYVDRTNIVSHSVCLREYEADYFQGNAKTAGM
jgi:hypothetical protein